MDSLKEFLLSKRFSVYGYIVAVFNVLAGVIVTFITAIKSTERRQFQCNSHGILADKDFLTTKCFNQYSQEYNSFLPLYGFALMSSASLVMVCIIYSWCCVKSRVEQIEQECTPNQDNMRPAAPIISHYIFTCYLVHLLIRLVLGIVYAIPQLTGLYALDFPSKFQCKWNLIRPNSANFNTTYSNSSSEIIMNCQNSFAEEKTVWAKVVWILHIIFACLVLFEVFYLLVKGFQDKTFTRDLEFCQKHFFNNRIIPLSQRDFSFLRYSILQQTEYLEPLIPLIPSEDDNRRAIDDVYIDLVIHSGWTTHDLDMNIKERHELLDVYLKPPEGSLQINNINELFVSEQKSYHRILVIGRPGIGKTSLCTKIIRNWCKSELNRFKVVFLFRFRHLSGERFNQMSLIQFLHETENTMNIDPDTLQNVMDNPQLILFIFDGFDEYKHRENLIKDQSEFNGLNGWKDEMPLTALYAKLLQKKLLPGATILTTSRPNAIDTLKILNVQFDRVAEILGFTPAKVKSYIHKFCKDNATTATRIWQHIESNVNLLYLCYIPVNCWIVCSMLDNFIVSHTGKSSVDSLLLPTTLTDIYKGALRLFWSGTIQNISNKPLLMTIPMSHFQAKLKKYCPN